ncbi:MAG: Ig-like domain-containing protein [Clostridia bacterium]|nr:Ig-like domain-containing protein [Clostridia bacterium]
MKKRSRAIILILLALSVCISAAFALMAGAEEKTDAMIAIEENLSSYRVGDTVKVKSDDYVLRAPNITAYYDYSSHGAAVPDYRKTQLVIYVVNTNTERIGTKSDVDIIKGMLSRGYVVAVLDYLNASDAKSPNIDWSIQINREDIYTGKYFSDTTKIPAGSFYDNHVVPAGYDVSPYMTFWETDKHGAEGSLEEIVENWNTDLRKTNGERIIPWVGDNGRKATQNCFEGTSPVWYMDANGTAETEAGKGTYTKLKYTKAESVYDCVGPEGEPLELSLGMHIVYPTQTAEKPIDDVPLFVNCNSSGHITLAVTSADKRPIVNGGLFNGYAGVIYDYLWFPMCRNEYYGYYDGRIQASGGYTGDQMNYALQLYNDKRINTAAMRYLKYLSLSEHDTYCFDTESIGVYGNSKGSWITFLGNPELKNYTSTDTSLTTDQLEELIDTRINNYISRREFPGHSGETRYQVGEENCLTKSTTKNGITIDPGERQPWLTYNGKEILGNAHFLYACCGPMVEDMVPGHAPMVASMNFQDVFNSAYASSNDRSVLFKTLDIPSIYFIADVGHMYTFGPDQVTGIDTYDAFFDFMGYYLKDDAVKVLYTTPLASTPELETDSKFSIKFTGPVKESELSKITFKDKSGNTVLGTWESSYGRTEWCFTPNMLKGGTEYTLTVPAGFSADNGVAMTESYIAKYMTKAEMQSDVTAYPGERGTYFVFKNPDLEAVSDLSFRFHVSNDAANVADLYAVSEFSASAPDSSLIGELIGSVNLRGSGYYEIDITEYSANNCSVGDDITLLLRSRKQSGVLDNYSYVVGDSTVKKGSYITATVDTAPDSDSTAALKVIVGLDKTYQKQDHTFYQYPVTLFTNNTLISSSKLTEADLGRKFRITLSIYDTTERLINIRLNSATSLDEKTIDVDGSIYNFYTAKDQWKDLSFDYTVYETDFGDIGEQVKKLTVTLQPNGADESPAYIKALTVTEIVTDIELASDAGCLVGYQNPEMLYKYREDIYPFCIGETVYGTLVEALTNAKSGDVITMKSNYRVMDSDKNLVTDMAENVTLDMNGYRISLVDDIPLFNAYAASNTHSSTVTFKNGSVSAEDVSVLKASGTVAGSGKVFNVVFENVYIFTAKNSRVSDFFLDTGSSAAESKINISLNNCTLNVKTAYITKNPVTVLSGFFNSPEVSYTLKGGKIVTDSFVRQTFSGDYRNINIVPDEEDEITRFYSSESSFLLKDIGAKYNSEYVYFLPGATSGFMTEYIPSVNPNATDYGIIAKEYRDIDLYPVVIFDSTGDFSKGYDQISGALNYFATYSAGDEWYIYLRRDLTFSKKYNNLSNGEGTVYVDLGGHTVTLDGVMLYNADAKNNGDITVNTYNGTVLASTLGAVRILGWASSGYDVSDVKNFDFNFSDIKFALASGATTSNLVTYNYVRNTDGAPANNLITFTDCVFDISGASKATTLFNVGNLNGGNTISSVYKLYGCEIVTDNAANLDVYNLVANTESSIYFNKNANGDYLKITAPASATLPDETYLSSEEGLMEIVSLGTSGDNTVYSLIKSDTSLLTPYGDIPDAYSSLESYPWVVFKKLEEGKYECIGGGTLFTTSVMSLATETAGSGAVIYLRTDYNMETAGNKAGVTYIGRLNGDLTVDLGGRTVTMGNAGSADALLKCEPFANGYVTNVRLINGTIDAGSDALVRFCTATGDAAKNRTPSAYFESDDTNPQTFNVELEDLTINASASATANFAISTSYSNKSGKVDANVRVVNCDINITNTDVNIDLFETYPSTSYEIIAPNNVMVGGKITVASLTKFGFTNFEHTIGDTASLKFAKNEDGEYTSLSIGSNAMPTSEKFTDASDPSVTDLRFLKNSLTGCGLYRVSELDLETEYGTIEEEYGAMPWVVFKADKTFVTGTALFTTVASEKACLAGSGSVILLRRDFNFDEDRQNSAAQSISTLDGSILIDLGGNTVTMGNGGGADAFIRGEVYGSGYTTVITVKNGRILTGQDPIVRFSAITSRMPEGYENITDKALLHNFYVYLESLYVGLDPSFEADSSKTYYPMLYTMASSGVTLQTANNNVIVNDCTIDIGAPSAKRVIFASNVSIPASVTVQGSTIIYSYECGKVTVEGMNRTNGSEISFVKNSNGEYLTIKSHRGESVTSGSFNVNGSDFILKQIEGTSQYDFYTLTPKLLKSFKPKTSILVSSELLYNIYIPNVNELVSISINGAEKALADLEKLTLDDGIEYYRIAIGYPSYRALDNLEAIIKVSIDGVDYETVISQSLYDYSAGLAESGETDEIKTLGRDLLSYIRAAYSYFGKTSDKLSSIDAILGVGYDEVNLPDVSKAAQTPIAGSGFDKVTLYLGATPTFRFYMTEGYAAEEFAFTVGGESVIASAGADSNGNYLEISTYAFAMNGDVVYTVRDNTYTYNVYSYLEWAKVNAQDAAGLVTRMIKYCESALAYKNSITNV